MTSLQYEFHRQQKLIREKERQQKLEDMNMLSKYRTPNHLKEHDHQKQLQETKIHLLARKQSAIKHRHQYNGAVGGGHHRRPSQQEIDDSKEEASEVMVVVDQRDPIKFINDDEEDNVRVFQEEEKEEKDDEAKVDIVVDNENKSSLPLPPSGEVTKEVYSKPDPPTTTENVVISMSTMMMQDAPKKDMDKLYKPKERSLKAPETPTTTTKPKLPVSLTSPVTPKMANTNLSKFEQWRIQQKQLKELEREQKRSTEASLSNYRGSKTPTNDIVYDYQKQYQEQKIYDLKRKESAIRHIHQHGVHTKLNGFGGFPNEKIGGDVSSSSSSKMFMSSIHEDEKEVARNGILQELERLLEPVEYTPECIINEAEEEEKEESQGIPTDMMEFMMSVGGKDSTKPPEFMPLGDEKEPTATTDVNEEEEEIPLMMNLKGLRMPSVTPTPPAESPCRFLTLMPTAGEDSPASTVLSRKSIASSISTKSTNSSAVLEGPPKRMSGTKSRRSSASSIDSKTISSSTSPVVPKRMSTTTSVESSPTPATSATSISALHEVLPKRMVELDFHFGLLFGDEEEPPSVEMCQQAAMEIVPSTVGRQSNKSSTTTQTSKVSCDPVQYPPRVLSVSIDPNFTTTEKEGITRYVVTGKVPVFVEIIPCRQQQPQQQRPDENDNGLEVSSPCGRIQRQLRRHASFRKLSLSCADRPIAEKKKELIVGDTSGDVPQWRQIREGMDPSWEDLLVEDSM